MMREYRKNEVLVGITVLAGVVILFFGISYFKNWSFGDDGYSLLIRFSSSAGLQRGDQVTVNGVRAGKVTSITLDGNTVLVDAVIQSDIPVTRDAQPTIQMLELMGGKKIDIAQGTGVPVTDRSHVLEGSVDPDIAGALGMVGDMEGDIRSLGENANALMHNVNTLIGDKQFIGDIKVSVRNLREVAVELNSFIGANRDEIRELMTGATSLVSTLDSLLTDLTPGITGSVQESGRLLGNVDSLVTELRVTLADIRDSRGLLNSVIHDTSLPVKLDKMLMKLDTLSSIINSGELKVDVSVF